MGNVSSVQVYKQRHKQLKTLSWLTGETETKLIDDFIQNFYNAIKPILPKVVAEGKEILFEYEINFKTCPKFPMVLKQRQVDFSKSNEQLDEEMLEDVELEFSKLDKKINEEMNNE